MERNERNLKNSKQFEKVFFYIYPKTRENKINISIYRGVIFIPPIPHLHQQTLTQQASQASGIDFHSALIPHFWGFCTKLA